MNIYDLPYVDMQKVAGEGPDPYAEILVSGDPEALFDIMSDEDKAFHKLSQETVTKLAYGEEWTEAEINAMSDDDVSAITVLGAEHAAEKVARYLGFYNETAAAERAGRGLAQQMALQQKQASMELEKAAVSIAEHPAFKHELAKMAAEELERRRHGDE